MIQTRIFEWEEYKKPTVKIFSAYEINHWRSESEEFEVYVTSQPILDFTKNKIEIWSKQREERKVWLGVNTNKKWKEILIYRNSQRASINFAFYLNSIISLESSIEETIKEMNKEDIFVFNSPFAKRTFENNIERKKQILYSINSVSGANIDYSLFEKAKRVRKNNQICIFCRLNPYKNIHQILEALSKGGWKGKIIIGILPNKTNVGRYYLEYLESLIRAQGLNVVAMRQYGQCEIGEIMAESLACIIVSTSFEETQGKVIIESANNCCLPITNRWNGHLDYLTDDYKGIVKTTWNPMEGITINKEELIKRIKNIAQLYETNKKLYAGNCLRVLKLLESKSKKQTQKMQPNRGRKLDYLGYIEHFADIKIEVKDRTLYQQDPSFNIDFYIWLRQTNKENQLDENLKLDYLYLKRNKRFYEYAPLLDLITNDCLVEQIKNKENLIKIINLIESRQVYANWCQLMKAFSSL